MTKVSFSMPWGGVWVYEMHSTPRLGEHVALGDVVYVVCEVRHFPASNNAWIGLKNAG